MVTAESTENTMKLSWSTSQALANVLVWWRTWNLPSFILFSLCLQIFLFLVAPFRKRSAHWAILGSVWLAYQLVGFAIDRSLALIKSSNKQQSDRAEFADLYTFWAAFLVLHFGGPDTITALSMEDNDLWRRVYAHIVALVVGIVNALYSLHSKQRLLQPTILIFLAGTIKSGERVYSLTTASFDTFQRSVIPMIPNPVIDYAAISEQHDLYVEAGKPVEFVHHDPEPTSTAAPVEGEGDSTSGSDHLNDAQLVIKASYFFFKFKGVYVDMVYCCHDRKESRDFFLRLSWQDAFRVVETQMKFAFEFFYTKMPLRSLRRGYFLPCICFFLEVGALILWSLEYKHHFRSTVVKITWALLLVTVLIDIIAFVLISFSDQQMPYLANTPSSRIFRCFIQAKRLISCIISRQWSESISQFNVINYSIDERCKYEDLFYTLIGAKDLMDGLRYVSRVRLTDDLEEFIFQEIRNKSVRAGELDIFEEASSSRGSWVLRCNAGNGLDPPDFEPWIMDVEYDESVLIWHIATELCYQTEEEPDDDVEKRHRQFSKTLSDYILFLFFQQPKIMSEVAPAAKVIFQDTWSEARRFFYEEMPSSFANKEACERIRKVPTKIPPSYIKDESRSVLFDGCRLAEYLIELKRINGGQLWMLTSQIWVELLCYAAGQTPGRVHLIQLCKGGELLTLVRLLMLQLGLSYQFRKAKRIRRAELVVGQL